MRDGGARLRRRYQRSFVACVDKYDKMSSLRDSSGCRGFRMIIICPLSCNELLQQEAGTKAGCIFRPLLSTENENGVGGLWKVYTSTYIHLYH